MAGLPPNYFLPPGHPAWHQALMAQQQAQIAAQVQAQAQAQAQAVAQVNNGGFLLLKRKLSLSIIRVMHHRLNQPRQPPLPKSMPRLNPRHPAGQVRPRDHREHHRP